jgi:hypothetical protein
MLQRRKKNEMERKRKSENQGGTPKKQKTTIDINPTTNHLQPGEVLVYSSNDNIQWIATSTDSEGDYKGFVRSGTFYRLGTAVYLTTDDAEEPFIAEIVGLYARDNELCAEVRYGTKPRSALQEMYRDCTEEDEVYWIEAEGVRVNVMIGGSIGGQMYLKILRDNWRGTGRRRNVI